MEKIPFTQEAYDQLVKALENLKNVEIQSLNLFTTDFLIAFIMWLCMLSLKEQIKQALLSKHTLSWIPFH